MLKTEDSVILGGNENSHRDRIERHVSGLVGGAYTIESTLVSTSISIPLYGLKKLIRSLTRYLFVIHLHESNRLASDGPSKFKTSSQICRLLTVDRI
jgi:hypothetical protein